MKLPNIQNMQPFSLKKIPFEKKEIFTRTLRDHLTKDSRMIALFCPNKKEPNKILTVLANSKTSNFSLLGGIFPKDNLSYDSLSKEYPHVNYFECELAENNGYTLQNHPWQRPVRKQTQIMGDAHPYQFYKMEGHEIHEVAVGPIHAGIIEPGHFRFQCHGELVHHLEINLGYQHRGIESMMINCSPSQRIALSESIAGDSVIAHTYSHCSVIESLTNTEISFRAKMIRSIAEELERIAMHIAGLAGLANDIGFAIVSSAYGKYRTLIINTLALLSGSRFGRGLFIYGGIRFDIDKAILEKILENLEIVKIALPTINDFFFSSPGAMLRFEEVGIVTHDYAKKIGLVGVSGRASGIKLDTRIDYPYGAYQKYPVSIVTFNTCDVFSRTKVRALEIDESFKIIFELIKDMPQEDIQTKLGKPLLNSGVISMVEGFRGEVVHIGLCDERGNIMRYKIKDPSFNNWYGLSLAMRRVAISDFPLSNKSFDLSYSGHDL